MTSPNHGPSSHNLPPTVGPDYIEGLPEALQMDKIDAFRGLQEAHIVAAISGMTDYTERMTKRSEAIADFGDMAADFLKSEGIDETDPKFDEFKALLLRYAITEDGFSPSEWENQSMDAAGNIVPSEREKVIDALRVEYPDSLLTPPTAPPASPPTAPTVPIPKTAAEIKGIVDALPEIIKARKRVEILCDELANLSAKRQQRLFTRSGLQGEYDRKQTQYQEAVNELVIAELKAEKDAGKDRTEDEERLMASFKLVDNFRQLQEKAIEVLKGTKLSKFIEFMTSGSTPMRILKGVGLGVVVGAAGAGLMALTAGTAGGAVAAGAVTAGTSFTRFARGFATFDNKGGRGFKAVEAADENSAFNTEAVKESGAEGKDNDETIDLVNKYLYKRLEADTKNEQSKRRKATAMSMGAVVLGSLAAEAIHVGVDAATSHYNIHNDNNWLTGEDNANAKPGSGHETGNGSGSNTDPGAGGKPEVGDIHHFDAEGQTLHKGDGFYSVFEQMNKGGGVNIPQKDWSALLEQAGPKLHDLQVDGHPLAYRMPNGEWGVRMTSDGMFPKEGMDIIASTHDHMNGITAATGHVTDRATEVAPHNHATFEADASDASGADADMTTEVRVDPGMIDNVLDKPVVSPSDISSNPTLSQLTHVIPDSHASYLANKLNLRPSEWQPVEEYIAHQTSQHRPLYDNVFNITTNGVVEFKTNTLPPATMADIITHIPTSVRSRL